MSTYVIFQILWWSQVMTDVHPRCPRRFGFRWQLRIGTFHLDPGATAKKISSVGSFQKSEYLIILVSVWSACKWRPMILSKSIKMECWNILLMGTPWNALPQNEKSCASESPFPARQRIRRCSTSTASGTEALLVLAGPVIHVPQKQEWNWWHIFTLRASRGSSMKLNHD